MKGFTTAVKWATAAALLVALTAVPAFAAKTTPATDKNTNVPAVPRAIPQLIPYHKFDPPKSKAFDSSKLTVSGDMRVRPEFRTNNTFGSSQSNAFFTQQLIRLGFNYDLSPDVSFFLQPQVSNNFGSNTPGFSAGGVNPNGTGSELFLRQGFMLVRDFVAKGLTMKAGRQLVVWGNHRMFGHFDWNNVGFAFDGVTLRYNHKSWPVEAGWLVVAEGNCANNAGGCGAGKANGGDANIMFVRHPGKHFGLAWEPAIIVETGGAGSATAPHGGQPSDNYRVTMGTRIAGKKGIVDATFEGYRQFGDAGTGSGGPGRNLDIEAFAVHIDGGVTLPVPMQPRLGMEFNYASGDGDAIACNADVTQAACGGSVGTFSQLFPTNHIHFGYMDRQSWQNMVHYQANLQLRPTKSSHFEVAGHIFRKAIRGDFWYGAGQSPNGFGPGTPGQAGATSKDIGKEIDVIYTMFFQGNTVGWQTGYGVFFAGDMIDQAATPGGTGSAPAQSWGYTQLWINF
jgi:hypothetical protein